MVARFADARGAFHSWAFFLIDRFGRRILFIVGAAGGAISMYIIAGYIQVAAPQDNPTDTIPPSGVMALAFFYICELFGDGCIMVNMVSG